MSEINSSRDDLPFEETKLRKDIEEIRFENKVFEKNAKFVLTKNGITSWFQTEPDKCLIPDFARRNKLAFEKKMCKYRYDKVTGILSKLVTGVDGISKLFFVLFYYKLN